MYDGAATFEDVCLNWAMLAGTNLLKNLVKVLTRFRLTEFAYMADLCECFLHVAMPEAHILFRIIWFSNGNEEAGTHRCFVFRDTFD